MFRSKNLFLITPEMSKYITDSTNKSIKTYLNKYNVNALLVKDISPNSFALLPFVSFISFLVGYNFNKLLKP
jgi:hypothetical protein